jgi:hypothetical protein
MLNDEEFRWEATKIVVNNFGISTAKIFEPLFMGKTQLEIIASLEKLLVEFVGRDNAEKQLEGLIKKI